MARLLKSNYNRANFLTIRSSYHAQIKNDFIAIPLKLKAAIESVRAEQGVQSYDLWKPADLESVDDFFSETEDRLLEEGLSTALAGKFATPETFLSFITDLLSGPYAINETVEDKPFVLTINLMAFFNNPVQDLRTLMPKFMWYNEAAWKKADTWDNPYGYTNPAGNNQVYASYDDSLLAEQGRITSIDFSFSYGSKIYHLNSPYYTEMYIDTSYYIEPITLVRDNGTPFSLEIDGELPYFNDYTFAGLFPEMDTRAKWLAFIRQWEPEIN